MGIIIDIVLIAIILLSAFLGYKKGLFASKKTYLYFFYDTIIIL